MKTTRIKISDMSCEACVASTRRALQGVAGVRAVNVSLAEGRATVESAESTPEQTLLTALTDAGYEAELEKN